MTKIGNQAWAAGAKVYWDNTNKRCTTVATEAAAGGAGDIIGRVRRSASL